MGRTEEAFMPADMVRRVLAAAGTDVVLVGGQALAFWMDRYGIEPTDTSVPAVTRDVDFFTHDAAQGRSLHAFAKAIGGQPAFATPEAITALVGSAVAPAEPGRVYNVDLLHSVVGLKRKALVENAVHVELPGLASELRVMHPLDVLQSRNANLHTLADKQDAVGQMQLRLAIKVARRYLEETIDGIETSRLAARAIERATLDAIGGVIGYASEDAAKKNAARYGIHLADTIPAWRVRSATFWTRQWPHVRERMSPGYAARCELLAGRKPTQG